jgi:hypothetical protein
MNIFKINDIIIKMDNYEHKIENIFRLGSIYKKLSRPINAIKHLSAHPQYAKWGWCAAMTLRQYLVCRECRKVAQHWYRL